MFIQSIYECVCVTLAVFFHAQDVGCEKKGAPSLVQGQGRPSIFRPLRYVYDPLVTCVLLFTYVCGKNAGNTVPYSSVLTNASISMLFDNDQSEPYWILKRSVYEGHRAKVKMSDKTPELHL